MSIKLALDNDLPWIFFSFFRLSINFIYYLKIMNDLCYRILCRRGCYYSQWTKERYGQEVSHLLSHTNNTNNELLFNDNKWRFFSVDERYSHSQEIIKIEFGKYIQNHTFIFLFRFFSLSLSIFMCVWNE